MTRQKIRNPYTYWNPEEATPYSDGKPDSAMVPYIEFLRSRGIVTYSSCSGHPAEAEEEEKWGFIQIEDVELDLDVIDRNSYPNFSTVTRIYPGPVWEIKFRGLTESEEVLQESMEVIFEAIGVEIPK